jgi:hypothetical protein
MVDGLARVNRDTELAGTSLLYAGLAMTLLGVLGLVRPLQRIGLRDRRTSALLGAAGAGSVAAALALPVTMHRIGTPETELDRVLPEFQFRELHEITIPGTAEEIFRAIEAIRADEILFFRTLTWIRSPRLARRAESILDADGSRPILEIAIGTGFVTLARLPARELVVGTVVLGRCSGQPCTREQFVALRGAGYAKAAMSFLITPAGAGIRHVRTETRIVATDAASARAFARYWRLIYPGSALIRRMWLRAVRTRVASAPVDARQP